MAKSPRSESGAVIVMFGVLLIVLLVFAAFAVDLGAAWAQRRKNQSAADAAVMAAALEVPAANSDLVAEVRKYVDLNLGYIVADAEWTACTDPQGLAAGFVPLEDPPGTVLTECVSLKQSGTVGREALLRVNIPVQQVPTHFARVIGFDHVGTTGSAEAELDYSFGGGALPFVLPSNPSIHHCLATPPGGLANDPCSGPARGKFGVIESDFFGSDNPGTPYCQVPPLPSTNEKLTWNAALGLDHVVVPAPLGAAAGDGVDECAAVDQYIPYALRFDPGNPQTLLPGLMGDGPYGLNAKVPGRLRQVGGFNGSGASPLDAAGNSRAVPSGTATIYLDNVGLWEYLVDTGNPKDVCDPNNAAFAMGGPNATDQLELCLTTGNPRFVDEILTSPRFGLVPALVLDQASLDATTPGTVVNVLEMRPVYLHAAFFNCTATSCMVFSTNAATSTGAAEDRQFFSPGEGTAEGCLPQGGAGCKTNVNLQLDGIGAWVLERSWVPPQAFLNPDPDLPISVLLYR